MGTFLAVNLYSSTSFSFSDIETLDNNIDQDHDHEIHLLEGNAIGNLVADDCRLIERFFNEFADADQDTIRKVLFLAETLNYPLEYAFDNYENVNIVDQRAKDYAVEYMNEVMEVPEHLEFYIDHERFSRDMELNGEWFELGGYADGFYTVVNSSEL